MGQRIIGLDIGSYALKAVEIDSTFRGFQLVNVKERRVVTSEGDDASSDREAIRAWLAEEQGVPETILCSLPGDAVMVRFLKLPFRDRKRISEVIGFELQDHIPFDIDEVVYDYQIVSQSEESSRILAVAVPRERLERYLSALKEAGVDPKAVGFGAWSYLNLAPYIARDGQESVAFVDIGHRRTDVCVFRGQQMEFLRTANRAGAHLDETVAERLGVDIHEADLRKRRAGRLPAPGTRTSGPPPLTGLEAPVDSEEALSAALVEGVEDILRDIRMALLAHEAEYAYGVSRIVLTGGGARLTGLAEYMEERLRVPVERFDSTTLDFNRMVDRGTSQEVLAKGLALSLQGLGASANSEINLRRGPYAYEGEFRFLRERLVAIVLMVVAVLSIGGLRACSRYESLEGQRSAQVAELETLSKELLGAPMADHEAILTALKKGADEQDDPFPAVEAFDIFNDISAILDEANHTSRGEARESEGEDTDKKPRPATPLDDEDEDEVEEEDEAPAAGGDAASPPEDRYIIELESVDIGADRGTLKGQANDIEAYELFFQRLKLHDCLRRVQTQSTDIITFRRHTGWRQFQIKFDVDCAARKKAKETKKDAVDTPEEPSLDESLGEEE